jgi:hypothetical protein
MTSEPFVAYLAESTDIQQRLEKEIRNAEQQQRPLSFVAVSSLHPLHEPNLGKIVKRVVVETNSRVGKDWIIRQAPENRYFVILGADVQYACDWTKTLHDALDGQQLKYTGAVMYLPKSGTPEAKAEFVYSCLSNQLEDHRRIVLENPHDFGV